MGSIPKIVSTPLKWASKKILDRTLLRFPRGDAQSPIACTYCPEMCRFSCPTAVVSGNDAVTPLNKMSLLYKEDRWPNSVSSLGELWPLYDCTGCGRCTDYCVYGMPVADRLFQARSEFQWGNARQAALEMTPELDPYGDLAFELGDLKGSQQRLDQLKSAGQEVKVAEPKSLHFLKSHGVEARLSWEGELRASPHQAILDSLSGKRWLIHESVWLSRRLQKFQEVSSWIETALRLDVKFVVPFANGKDCIDCGGEGAYAKLFPKQARQMALDFWERDQHQADGVFCFSQRCASHLKSSLSDTSISSAVSIVVCLSRNASSKDRAWLRFLG